MTKGAVGVWRDALLFGIQLHRIVRESISAEKAMSERTCRDEYMTDSLAVNALCGLTVTDSSADVHHDAIPGVGADADPSVASVPANVSSHPSRTPPPGLSEFGLELFALRLAAIDAGMKLVSAEEINARIRAMRGA